MRIQKDKEKVRGKEAIVSLFRHLLVSAESRVQDWKCPVRGVSKEVDGGECRKKGMNKETRGSALFSRSSTHTTRR